jgi:hypothetical protein
MAIDFPGTPNVDDTFTSGGIIWKFDGTKWVQQLSINLDAITDIDTTGKSNGDTLIYDEETNTWVPGAGSGSTSYATTVAFGF